MLSCRFEAKQPYTTWWVSLEYEVGNQEDEQLLPGVLERLRSAGFQQNSTFAPASPPPAGYRHQVELDSLGTGLFNGWTPEERKFKLKNARKALRDIGFEGKIPMHRLTLADLL